MHDQAILSLRLLLTAWASRVGRDVLVARNLACRWDPSDARVRIAPDLVLVEPTPPLPPGKRSLRQLRLWEDHAPPMLTVEVVSETSADRDYLKAPSTHADAGTRELWIFDPELLGPASPAGPFRLQIWQRQVDGSLLRTHAGNGPAWSEQLQAWLHADGDGTRLRLSDDRAGRKPWLSEAETLALSLKETSLALRQERRARKAAEQRADAAESELAALRARTATPG